MQNAEQQIAENRRERSTDRDCFGSLENPLLGAGERPTMAAARLALLELQMGMACYRERRAGACHSRFRAAKSADEDRGSLRCAARRSFTLLCCAGSPQFPFSISLERDSHTGKRSKPSRRSLLSFGSSVGAPLAKHGRSSAAWPTRTASARWSSSRNKGSTMAFYLGRDG